jgi:hypothetical protein
VLLGQEALVLGLQVRAPLDGVLELLAAGSRLEDLDRLGVGQARKGVSSTCFRRSMRPFSMRSSKNFMSSARSVSRL